MRFDRGSGYLFWSIEYWLKRLLPTVGAVLGAILMLVLIIACLPFATGRMELAMYGKQVGAVEVQCDAFDVVFTPHDFQSRQDADEVAEMFSLSKECRADGRINTAEAGLTVWPKWDSADIARIYAEAD